MKERKPYITSDEPNKEFMVSDYIVPYETLFESPLAKLGAINMA